MLIESQHSMPWVCCALLVLLWKEEWKEGSKYLIDGRLHNIFYMFLCGNLLILFVSVFCLLTWSKVYIKFVLCIQCTLMTTIKHGKIKCCKDITLRNLAKGQYRLSLVANILRVFGILCKDLECTAAEFGRVEVHWWPDSGKGVPSVGRIAW